MSNPTTFNWVEPTKNTDGTNVTSGEITGYNIGIRPSSGTPGTYTSTVTVTGATTLSAPISAASPALVSGSYMAAIQSIGPTDSTFSAEVAFTLAGTPVPPSGFSVG
jgi:hypothetical protein